MTLAEVVERVKAKLNMETAMLVWDDGYTDYLDEMLETHGDRKVMDYEVNSKENYVIVEFEEEEE